MRNLFKWQLFLSAIFVLDCAAAPMLKVPFSFVLIIYVASMAESIGLVYLLKAFKKKWLKGKRK